MPSLRELHEVELRHAQYYLDVLRTANERYIQGGEQNIAEALARFKADWDQITKGQSWAASSPQEDTTIIDNRILMLCESYASFGTYLLRLHLLPNEHICWVEAAQKASEKLKSHSAEVMHLNNLGWIYAGLGEPSRAIVYHEKALDIARKIDDHYGEGTVLTSLGSAYYVLGEIHRAIEYHRKAQDIVRKISGCKGKLFGNLSSVYNASGETRHAIKDNEKALKAIREISNRSGIVALNNLGIAYRASGELRRAIECHEKALNIASKIGDHEGEANALGNLGSIYYGLPKEIGTKFQQCEICSRQMQKIEDGRGIVTVIAEEKRVGAGTGTAEECWECGRLYCDKCYPSRPKNTCVCGKDRDEVRNIDGVIFKGSLRLIKVRYLSSDYMGKSRLNPLHSAVSTGNIAAASRLLEYGVDVDAREPIERQTPLHFAVRHLVNHPGKAQDDVSEMVRLLIEFGADVNIADNDGITPLHWAAGHHFAEVVRILIEAGADVNAKDKFLYTPLHQVANSSHLEIPRMLIEAGVNVNVKSTKGETALTIAERNMTTGSTGRDNYEDLRNLLRKHGAVR